MALVESQTLPEQTLASVVEPPVEASLYECKKCARMVTFENLAAEKHDNQAQGICRMCHNLQAMIGKRWGLRNFQQALDPERQAQFFKRCLATSAESGVLSFKHVRAELKEQVSESFRTETQTGIEGAFKPLSVWAKEGYDTSIIEAKA